jgi:hypothetical protein
MIFSRHSSRNPQSHAYPRDTPCVRPRDDLAPRKTTAIANSEHCRPPQPSVAQSERRASPMYPQPDKCHPVSIFSNVTHRVERYANNRVEALHQPTRQRERQMRRFKSARHAQRFLSLHDAVRNLFRVGRHLLRSSNHRLLRSRSFAVWRVVTAA